LWTSSYLLSLGVCTGADHFEGLLIDHEVCSNYGNWAFSAGIGTRGQRQRRFNILKQAAGDEHSIGLIRRWLPELELVPDGSLYWPWEWAAAGNVLGYPLPLTVPKWSAKGRSNAQNKRWKKRKGRVHRGEDGREFKAI
jgi:deoxyribodipyrimidine photo-lyase